MKKKRKSKATSPARYITNYLISALLALLFAATFTLHNTDTQPRLPSSDKPAELYANQTHDDLTKAFTTAIDQAKHSVLLIIYSLTDPEIIASLRQQSLQGIDVRVICDAKASPHIDRKLGPKTTCLRRFGPGLMHQKILVIDEKQTWLGSANMTTESLQVHGNLVAAFDDPSLAQAIKAKASSMQVEDFNPPFKHQNFTIGGQTVELWFLPDDQAAISRLKALIRGAEKTIRIAMFTWTRQDLAQEVIAARKRGIDTQVVIDHTAGKGAGAKIVELLKKNKVPVALSQGGPLLHHKFLYIDSNLLVNGSANWTKAAFTTNDDCFLVIHPLTNTQKASMDNLWQKISSEALRP